MSDNWQDIEDKIKGKYSGREFGSPPNAYLEDLKKRLDKRSFPRLLFIIFLILFAATALIILDFGKDEVNFMQQYKNRKQIKHNNNSLLKQEKDSLAQFKFIALKREKNSLNTVLKLSSTKKEKLIIKEKQLNTSRNNTNLTSNKTTTYDNNKNVSNKRVIENYLTNHSKDKLPLPTNKDTTLQMNQTKQNESLPKVYNTQKTIDTTSINDNSTTNEPIKKQTLTTHGDRLDTSLQKIQNSVTNKHNFFYEIQLFGGIAMTFLDFYSNNQNFSSTLKKQIKNPVTPVFGGNINFYYRNWLFGTGVSFHKDKEIIKTFTFNQTTYDSIYIAGTQIDSLYTFYDSINSIWDTAFITSPIYDSMEVTNKTKQKNKFIQSYSWLSIPLRFGYKFKFNKWAILPIIGGNFVIGIKSNPLKYPESDFKSIKVFDPIQWHINILGSVEIRRYFSQWHVFVRGNYNYTVSPYQKTKDFELRYNHFNVIFGVGYQF